MLDFYNFWGPFREPLELFVGAKSHFVFRLERMINSPYAFGGAGGRGEVPLSLQNLQSSILFNHALHPFEVGANHMAQLLLPAPLVNR